MVEWEESTVPANGIQIHFWYNEADKQPVILLHGITDNGMCWNRLANELAGQYRLYLLDARGHGKSDKPRGDYSYPAMADDVASLVASLDIHQPIVIGHSMGAQTAAVLGARHPGIASKLILEDPPWWTMEALPTPKGRSPDQMKNQILEDQKLSVEALTARKMALSPLWGAAEFPYWSESKLQVDPEINTLTHQKPIPYTETVPAITCPGLLVTGDPQLGAIVTPEGARQILELNPLLKLAYIPGAGHNIRRENFDLFLKTILQFMES